VSYEELLRVFWEVHDPTQTNRQGPDIGTQYRSAIFFHTPEQEAAAKAARDRLQSSGRYSRPIVTEITPAPEFYRAEEYHQRYLDVDRRAHGCVAAPTAQPPAQREPAHPMRTPYRAT